MSKLNFDEIGLRVGLEIHQQLSTKTKLFCNCSPQESENFPIKFTRKLRLTKSELGKYDPAAVFEKSKSKTIEYYANPSSSCLVEQDEEPPHEVNKEAKEIALIIASTLESTIFSELYMMRKIVIDGSNTSGFQRTMLVSLGGHLKVNGKKIGVQSVSLEEDAAKLLNDNENTRSYSLDRLGIPLVEIALQPVSGRPDEIKNIALTLGRLLRASKRVVRGIGTIRQDVNVSISGGGIIEVKGVQKLEQLEKVIDYEAKRQHGMMIISNKLKNLKLEKITEENSALDVTQIFKNCGSKIIQKALKKGAIVKAIRVKKFAGIFGFEPYPGIRLGKELGELVRFFGIGGIFHSDELPNFGITDNEVQGIKEKFDLRPEDGFLIIAGDNNSINVAIDALIKRIEGARLGVPAETRAATLTGETVFLRPRPGASRMYPETDIPPVSVSSTELLEAQKNIPKSWDETLSELQNKYQLNRQLTEQIFDSDYLDLFEKICSETEVSPNFVTSILCSTITNLERQGLDRALLRNEEIYKSFRFLADNKLTKESIAIIFERIMSGKVSCIEEAIEKMDITSISPEELDKILSEIVKNNEAVIKEHGTRAISILMGNAMKTLRGKVAGQKISNILEEKMQEVLKSKN